ncbi:hypothetical protein MM239_12350 [Belliella sp. DSM 111904]|uniref:Uncharacterized protein n=1 Tax=Belliella filtrata TaxID=2923435 RepID=A0ABS9V1W6_9BACT|nr:hypothetical protein [Belliella filtrata]MCH7410190.1 hypothetical protein [Belliella filtrata]
MKRSKLKDTEYQILKSFIEHFLPIRGNERKNSGNEIDYISSTLELVFKKYFDFNVNDVDVLEIFEDLNYKIFTKNGKWDSENKLIKPTSGQNLIKQSKKAYQNYDVAYIYIDIEPKTVRTLKLTVKELPENTSPSKANDVIEMTNKIDLFINNLKVKY